MTVFNLGSINIDMVYRVPHIPAPGETLASLALTRGLGGKGANMSVALAASGATVRHFGAVGAEDGQTVLDTLAARGVDCTGVLRLDMPTGHAIVQVAEDGENAIILFPSANRALPGSIVDDVLAAARPGDWVLLQNETAHVPDMARRARQAGLRVAYAAAPFDADATAEILDDISLLAVNAVEARQMEEALGRRAAEMGVDQILVTRGAEGASLLTRGEDELVQPASVVTEVVDTTGAGDTFLGFFLGRLDQGDNRATCMAVASAAAGLAVQAEGAADAIPTLDQVRAAMGG